MVEKEKLGKWLAFQSVPRVFLRIEKDGISGQLPNHVICSVLFGHDAMS